jgi:hypothetical protein
VKKIILIAAFAAFIACFAVSCKKNSSPDTVIPTATATKTKTMTRTVTQTMTNTPDFSATATFTVTPTVTETATAPVTYSLLDFEPSGDSAVNVTCSNGTNRIQLFQGSGSNVIPACGPTASGGIPGLGNYYFSITGTVKCGGGSRMGYEFDTFSTQYTTGTPFPNASKLVFDYKYNGEKGANFYFNISSGNYTNTMFNSAVIELINDNAWHTVTIPLDSGFLGAALADIMADLSRTYIAVQSDDTIEPAVDTYLEFSIDNVMLTN